MDILFIIILILLLLIGVLGSFIPSIPGPLISYTALLISNFLVPFKNENLVWFMALVVILVTILDFWIQIYGVKKFGGGKKAINGSIIGLIIGLFFLPVIGIIIGPLLGSLIGARMEGSNINESIKISLGALVGFFTGVLLKFTLSIYIIYLVIVSNFSL